MKNYKNYREDINKLNEITFEKLVTSYKISNKILNGKDVEEYTFISNKGNSYSVYFMLTKEKNQKIRDNEYLKDYTDLDNIPTIFYSLSEREFGYEFDKLTNKNEYLEVMGKVVFLIREYINKHDYKVYSMGKVSDKKQDFYNYYHKHFKDFLNISGRSNYYNSNNCIFLIKDANQFEIDELKLEGIFILKIK